jgi:Tfp pilus assembly protein PilW
MLEPKKGYRGQRGLSIIQLMVVLFIAGLAGYFIIQKVVALRCESDPAAAMCGHAGAGEKER